VVSRLKDEERWQADWCFCRLGGDEHWARVDASRFGNYRATHDPTRDRDLRRTIPRVLDWGHCSRMKDG
jgi:hypothetical protein